MLGVPVHKVLSTAEFAEALGISESSVRRLADSGDLRIRRTRGGHRRIPVPEAIRYVRKFNLELERPDLLGLSQASGSSSDWPQRFEQVLTEGRYNDVIGLLQAMYLSGLSVAEICDGPVRHAMHSIGEHWPHNKRSIFVEHRATMLCIRALCQLRLSLPEVDEQAPCAMGGAPQDDPYLLPSLMASLVLHEHGFDEVNLGANTPVDIMTDSVEDERPGLVWLSVTSPIRSRNHHREIEKLAAVVTDYGGVFVIGGLNASSYTGSAGTRCSSMRELGELAHTFGDINA